MSAFNVNNEIVSKLSKIIDVLEDTKTAVEPLVGGRVVVADILGVSPDQVTEMTRTGKLPRPLVIGKTHKWLLSELKLWLEHGAPVTNKWEVVRKNLNIG